MAGKRLLLAAEFARGRSTLTRLLPLAVALADRGHDVTLAVPDTLRDAVGATGFPVLAAPRWTAPPPAGFVATSYPDLLMHGGWAVPDSLRDLTERWSGVLTETAADWLVADFAPTAMLAARVAGVPMAAVGDGFSLPPLTAPLPLMRPWADNPPDAAASIEGRVLAVTNARLAALKQREIRHLRALFDGVPSFLCAFPELDHYPDRADGAWYGAIFPPSRGPAPVWPGEAGRRVYVELDPRHPILPRLAEALNQTGMASLLQVGGAAPNIQALERGLVHLTTTGNRAALLAGADMVVCQSEDIAAQALLAGKPLLMAPIFTEQMMTLHRVAQQRLGHGVEPGAGTAAIETALNALADDAPCRMAAANFARSYDGYRPGIVIDAVADDLDETIG